ncbi:hypothetical protein QC761_201850 [Podospora bellae-mahoneyi]|nr:hypothetical protein QC761_201850 [Podospora bellae-mahoneyi]
MSTKTFRPLALLRPPARFYSSQPTPSPALLTRSSASTKPPTATPSPTSILASLFAPEQPSAPSPTGHTNYGFEAAEDVVKHQHRADMYLRKHPRRWREGDVYAPHDLSPAEAKKWKVVKSPKRDVIDMLGVNPLDNYRNFSMISEFMTPLGRIMHSKDTGLRPVNQRKMAKAIRRAIGLGIHPSVHRHPEVMKMRGRINTAMNF